MSSPSSSSGQCLSGQCLCGAVAFTIEGPMRDVWDCHCHRCRRWTGHHMAASRANVGDIQFNGTDNSALRWYAPEPSVEYGFCGTCGSSLFWRVVGQDSWAVCAGPLNTPTNLQTSVVWWDSERSDYLQPAPGGVITHATE